MRQQTSINPLILNFLQPKKMEVISEQETKVVYDPKNHISMFLGGGNDPNQQQENNIVIEYTDEENVKRTLRTEMLTGTTIFNQAAKCREFMDLLRQKDILEIIEFKKKPAQAGGGVDVVAQIEKLAKLKDAGVITEEEFAAKKAALLDKI